MKEKIKQLNERIDTFAASVSGKKLRITGSVLWNLTLLFIIFIGAMSIFGLSVGAGYFASLVKDEPLRSKKEMRELILNYEETSEIYFANEIYIGKLKTDLERQETTLPNISPLVIEAVLATEDEYFHEHDGIVPKAVFRSILQDMSNSSTQTGGSTLTQQLIKNQILTNEVSYERKAKEILLAFRLEKFMSKDEILEAYLNIIPYGRNANGTNIAGIETAAQGIFGVSASELTLPQAAYIAGIPQAPFKYTPFKQGGGVKSDDLMQHGVDRMKTVLFRMKEAGYITEVDYKNALAYDITKDFKQPEPRADQKYPWLTRELEKRAAEIMAKFLAKKDGIDPARLDEEENLAEKYLILGDREIKTAGYRIYSTIDKGLYDAMNEAAKNFQYYGQTYTRQATNEDGEEVTIEAPVQVGSVLIDNTSGRILSFVGGRDFNVEELNHATQAYRSNGSTMKPLLSYGPALEYGVIGAGSPVVDVKFKRGYDGYSPSNFTATEERGIIPAREALAYSQNLTALRLYDSIIDKKPATFLEKMGFSKLTDGDYVNLSTAIGGLTYGTTVEENANAYTTFANGGQFIDAYMIDKIVDLDGNTIYQHKASKEQVFSPETAYMMTDMLRDTMDYGTAKRANGMLSFSSDFAAKTGTSQEFKDMWFVGYNPTVTLGVWIGYDQPRSLKTFTNRYYEPGVRINMLWATLMNSAYRSNKNLIVTNKSFEKPDSVVKASFCGISGMAPSSACSNAGLVRSDWFNRAFLPKKSDDSFATGQSLVEINGKYYQALPSTPAEFVTARGFGLSAEFTKKMLGRLGGDASKLLPNNSSLSTSLSGSKFEADNRAPSSVTVTLDGNNVTWTKSGSNDVIGYRLYDVTNGAKLIKTIIGSSSRRAQVAVGKSYVVVAVDITGKESAYSNNIVNGVLPNPPVDETEQPNPTPTEPPIDENPNTPPVEEPDQPATETNQTLRNRIR